MRVGESGRVSLARPRPERSPVFSALTNLAEHRRRLVLVVALLVVVAGAAYGTTAFTALNAGDAFFDPDSLSTVAADQIEAATGVAAAPGVVALVRPADGATSPAGRERLAQVAATLRANPNVANVVAPTDPGPQAAALVSTDGRAGYLVATLRANADGADAADSIDAAFAGQRDVQLGGGEFAGKAIGQQVSQDLGKAEGLAFPILFVLLLFVFRGVVAALLPLIVGGFTVLATFLVMRLLNDAIEMSIYALNLIIALGLGLSIDYSLFVLSRYREEVAEHGRGAVALGRTLRTAGRTVLFSALTVGAALASLLVFPQQFLYSMGIGGIAVSLVAIVASLVFLPALLLALGSKVDALAPAAWRRAAARDAAHDTRGFWYRLSHVVMRRPAPIAIAAIAVLVVAGLPFLRATFIPVSTQNLPASAEVRQVDDALATQFAANQGSPTTVVLEAGADRAGDVNAYADRLQSVAGVASVGEPDPIGPRLTRIALLSAAPADSPAERDMVKAVRDVPAPAEVKVAGQSARFIDQQSSLGAHLPYSLALLATTTLVLLFLMTGSVVLPIKTFVLNLLTISVALGVLVLGFQDGRLSGLLDFTEQGGLEATQPILLAVLVFGLSTDYAVFLLTRIKEAHDAGATDRDAVAIGLQRTGRIVTAAALLFAVAIGAFATSEVTFIKLLGVGAAVAVLVDATIVRALLVPSLMAMLGRWNWWAPAPLRRFHSRFGLREGRPDEAAPAPVA